MIYPKKYDVIVVGGGHAGIEASLAAARLNCQTLLLTMNLDTIGLMSCNPAIGGLGKGQLVKEIDALGGEMAKAIDKTAIQFRRLNTKKGPAVQSSRAQADRESYRLYMKYTLENQPGLDIKQALVNNLLLKDISSSSKSNLAQRRIWGVETSIGERFLGECVIITPGTFLEGIIHIGLKHFSAGRMGGFSSIQLAHNLRDLGFRLGRFKTGTCPRLDGKSINFSSLTSQKGDSHPIPFSFSTEEIGEQAFLPCYITYTNVRTHQIIKDNLDRSPLYTGTIKATGVRYCPSIEDKVMKFPERKRHQVFLEPEGLKTREFYPNGLSTSLPLDVQIKVLRSIKGLERVEVMRPGYGIEHDYVDPTCLRSTLETKLVSELYFAGQINGTTGYEEAAAQGLIAGINAALRVKREEPLILNRAEAYIGVLIDDLVTRGTNEPYRMFTSRAEYRLLLREDNADIRLREKGYRVGLVSSEEHQKVNRKERMVKLELDRLSSSKIFPTQKTNEKLIQLDTKPIKAPLSLRGLLRRPEVTYEKLKILKKMENLKIPPGFGFQNIPGLSSEVKEKLSKIKPHSLGQASRISGITPAAISILMIHLKRLS
ncbi:tRNA uridine 5-carboxymethylaminomethyl modification enzyme MnmG [subsurface metagenome]